MTKSENQHLQGKKEKKTQKDFQSADIESPDKWAFIYLFSEVSAGQVGTSAWTWPQRPEPALLSWKPCVAWELQAAALLSVALPERCVGSCCVLTTVNESHLYTIREQVQKVACKSPSGSCLPVVACVQNGNFSVFLCQTGLFRSALIPVLELLVLVDGRLEIFSSLTALHG